ncbi:MAG: hypothetical protein GY705_00275 [Bacteroidetes bacterium]|nr:hypothetical protein [Bacteroidota bacterium]
MKKSISFILLFCSVLFISEGQRADTLFDLTKAEAAFENLHLFTDRDFYLTGEEIWFSAFYSSDPNISKKQLSNVLYLELYKNGQSYQKIKCSIREGIAQGALEIPDELISGKYFLRAYTQFDRNFPSEKYFTTCVTIINPETPPTAAINPEKKEIEIALETGKLINGIPSKIAVKLDDSLYRKTKIISIVNSHQKIITENSPLANGLSLLEFTPERQNKYYLKLTFNNGDSQTEDLPEINSDGIALSLQRSRSKLQLSIFCTESQLQQPKPSVKLSIISSQFTSMHEVQVHLTKKENIVEMPLDKLAPGINYCILEKDDGSIIQASAFYQFIDNTIKINAKSSKTHYKPRELVNLKLQTPFSDSETPFFLTISVVKKGTFHQKEKALPESVINNPLLLSSYLFNVRTLNESIQKQLEALLILNKTLYTTDDIIQILQKNIPAHLAWVPEIRDVSISGLVRDKNSQKPLPDVSVFASVIGENPQTHYSETRENGKFIFSLPYLQGKQNIFLSVKSVETKEVEILINNDFSTDFPEFQDIPISIDTSDKRLLEEMYVNAQTGQVYTNDTLQYAEFPVKFPFQFAERDISISLNDFVKLPSLEEVFNEIVPFVDVRKRKGQYYIDIWDAESKPLHHETLVLLDNVPIYNINKLMEVLPSKIEKIDIINRIYMLGDYTLGGVILIQTNTEDFASIKLPEKTIIVEYPTISPSLSFHHPDHTTYSKNTLRIPDFRNVLYWNPRLTLKKDTEVSFFASDHCSAYEVIIRGFTSDGKYCMGRSDFQVSR